MKKLSTVLAVALMVAVLPRIAAAGKVTYIANDHRFDFVILVTSLTSSGP